MIKISTDYSIVTVEQIIKDKQPFDKLVFHVKKLLNSNDFYNNKGS